MLSSFDLQQNLQEGYAMNIKKCKIGHYYDGDKHEKCPHCLSNDEAMNVPEKYRKLGALSRLDRGSTCRVYGIDSEPPLVLKVISCGLDNNKYNNALYEKRIIEALSQSERVLPILDFEVAESQDGKRTVYILENYHISLEQFVSINNCPPNELLKTAIDLCDAVQEVIDRGVFHLDLKPKKIFLADENKVILGDFGSSLLAGDLARNQSARGTPEYMAPEVYQEHHCSERSEIYSIGLIVYYLFNERKLPFVDNINDNKQRELATYKRLAGTELPLLSCNPHIEDSVNSIIKNACSYKSENRTKSISDLKSRLVEILRQLEESDESVTKSDLVPKRTLPIIFMIDTSGSMRGKRIAKLNESMCNVLSILTKKSEEHVDSEIRIAVLKYSSGCEWVTKGFVGIGDFQWKNINTGGMTDFGAAIRELNSMLSRSTLFAGAVQYCVPIIINITDGTPTDNWEKGFELIKQNKWFDVSKKICITIGDDADVAVLKKFCGTEERIIRVEDISNLKSLIAAISVSASMMSGGSQIINETTVLTNDDWGEDLWDADPIATTMALYPPFSSNIGDSDWDTDTWDADSFATSIMLPPSKDDDAAQRRRRLAEALRNGQNLLINSDGNTQINVSINSGNSSDDYEGITVPSGKLAGGYRCRICDTPVSDDTVFCPQCGSKIVIEKPSVQLCQVEFSAIAPKQIVKGEYSIIDIVMYEEAYRHIVDEIHSQSETETQKKKSGKINVKTEANIKVILHSNDIEIEDNEMTGVWQTSYLTFSFPIFLPDNYSKKQVLFIAKIFINDIIATRLTFTARCSSVFEQKINVIREDILTAFISYASQDRKKVATIVQGMQKARPDMDLFFDVESLRSGENWEKALFREIEKRDILYLCWSHHAKSSKWVDKEWRYAYSQKGIDGIEPIPIELPEDCPPPQELSGKHWNDKLLYLIGHLNKKPLEETLPKSESRCVNDTWE